MNMITDYEQFFCSIVTKIHIRLIFHKTHIFRTHKRRKVYFTPLAQPRVGDLVLILTIFGWSINQMLFRYILIFLLDGTGFYSWEESELVKTRLRMIIAFQALFVDAPHRHAEYMQLSNCRMHCKSNTSPLRRRSANSAATLSKAEGDTDKKIGRKIKQ